MISDDELVKRDILTLLATLTLHSATAYKYVLESFSYFKVKFTFLFLTFTFSFYFLTTRLYVSTLSVKCSLFLDRSTLQYCVMSIC